MTFDSLIFSFNFVVNITAWYDGLIACCVTVVPQLKKDLGKPRPGDVNPFLMFMKSKLIERGDAPQAVKYCCTLLYCLCQFCQHVD